MTIAFVLTKFGVPVDHQYQMTGRGGSLLAEFQALIFGLSYLLSNNIRECLVCTDCSSVLEILFDVKCVQEGTPYKDPVIEGLLKKIRDLLETLGNGVQIELIPREMNLADKYT